MPSLPTPDRHTALRQFLLVAGIIFIALNLRPALTGVGPLIGHIREDTGLSNAALGLLTTLPLLAFGVISSLTPLVTRRIGLERTLAAALFVLAVGILLRATPSVALLFVGTTLLGIAIAFGNVLLPSLVKRDFPRRTGVMTSVYSSSMGVGATVAAGVSVPLAVELGWRGSLAAWSVTATVALIIWLPQLRARTLPEYPRTIRESLRHLGRSPLAWHIACFMGLQSLTFYVILAWLPEILQSRGLDPHYAGWMLALSQGTGILGTMLVPTWAGRLHKQRSIVWVLAFLEGISLMGMLFPATILVPLWVSMIGFVLGGSFGLALLFIVLRTADAETTAELSGMAQSIGYLLAAIGPIFVGYLHDLTRGWLVPILFLTAILIAKIVSGLGAGRPLEVGR